jgi:hypothetical protein
LAIQPVLSCNVRRDGPHAIAGDGRSDATPADVKPERRAAPGDAELARADLRALLRVQPAGVRVATLRALDAYFSQGLAGVVAS